MQNKELFVFAQLHREACDCICTQDTFTLRSEYKYHFDRNAQSTLYSVRSFKAQSCLLIMCV